MQRGDWQNVIKASAMWVSCGSSGILPTLCYCTSLLMIFLYTTASQTSSDTTTSAGDDAAAEDRPAKKSKKGKKVTWPSDDSNLATFHFFEMDEDERGQFDFLSFQ